MSTRRPRRRRKPMSLATRKKISAALRGKRHPHRGHRPSAATRARESAAHKGKRHPHKGHRLSAATRAKISRALRGRHHKSRCHCGSSSKHSLKRRRAAHAQGAFSDPGKKTLAAKVTKRHTKKRSKVKSKFVQVSKNGLWAEPVKKTGPTKRRKGGPCRCPKKNAKKHARIRRSHTRVTHTKRQTNRGRTTIGFSG